MMSKPKTDPVQRGAGRAASLYDPIPRVPVAVTGKTSRRILLADTYERTKARNRRISAFRRANINQGSECAACGWRAPEVLQRHQRKPDALFFLSVHHVTPFSEGGTEDEGNLIVLCARCHEIADYLPRLVSLPTGGDAREGLVNHLRMLATDPGEWTRQYEAWTMSMKRNAVGSLRDGGRADMQPFRVKAKEE